MGAWSVLLKPFDVLAVGHLPSLEHCNTAGEHLALSFKPEHLERWPDLHEKFHRAGHLCTQNMQSIDAALAQELWDLTKEIGEIFAASKT